MRGRFFNIPAVGRAAGFALVAAMIVAAAVHLRRGATGPGATGGVAVAAEPLDGELARCQASGLAAQSDGACEAAWAENRRRFFTYRGPTDGPAVAGPPARRTGR